MDPFDGNGLQHVPTQLHNLDASARTVQQQQNPTMLPPDYTLKDIDICCGRGKRNWNHKGNVYFRNLIQANVDRYIEAPTKTDKTSVVLSIVDKVRQDGACFLKQDDAGRWYDIGDAQAREKVGHSLRDQVTAMKKTTKEGGDLSPCPSPPPPSSVLSSSMRSQATTSSQGPAMSGMSSAQVMPGLKSVPDSTGVTSASLVSNSTQYTLSPQQSRDNTFAYAIPPQQQQLVNASQQSINSLEYQGLASTDDLYNGSANFQNQPKYQNQVADHQYRMNTAQQQFQNQQFQNLSQTQIQPLEDNAFHYLTRDLLQRHLTDSMVQSQGSTKLPPPSQQGLADFEPFPRRSSLTLSDHGEELSHRMSNESATVLQQFGRRGSWRELSINSSSLDNTNHDGHQMQQCLESDEDEDEFDQDIRKFAMAIGTGAERRRSTANMRFSFAPSEETRRLSTMSFASVSSDFDKVAANRNSLSVNNVYRSSIRRSSQMWLQEVHDHFQQLEYQMEETDDRRVSALEMLKYLEDMDCANTNEYR